jgi:hypothetical protein
MSTTSPITFTDVVGGFCPQGLTDNDPSPYVIGGSAIKVSTGTWEIRPAIPLPVGSYRFLACEQAANFSPGVCIGCVDQSDTVKLVLTRNSNTGAAMDVGFGFGMQTISKEA